ncbi:MAG TPA: sensor histidine kinase [Thermoleophilaceae bacterium]|nr:sensor histidine kinase [Thermoleophilaceae bacterium]
MTAIASAHDHDHEPGSFVHGALMYEGDEGFLAGTVPYIRDGLERDEATLVVVSARKIRMLRGELGSDADAVSFADMAEVGANPARIIPAWRDFADEHSHNGGIRGIGEPIHPGRDHAEMVECHRHESLLNVAFADTAAFNLLCPYDVAALDPEVVETARATHPVVVDEGGACESDRFAGLSAIAAPFAAPLPEPAVRPFSLAFDIDGLDLVRRAVAVHAANAGIDSQRGEDVVLAANEVATNSVRYGGGGGELRMWREDGRLVLEIADSGRIDEPLAGRVCPTGGQIGGHGLWLVNQVCDLVQLRSFESGSVVRLHVRLG